MAAEDTTPHEDKCGACFINVKGEHTSDEQSIELDARRRSLDEYKLRCQDLRSENDSLKQEKDQRETDALQIISFLRRDAERKDELIESLKSRSGALSGTGSGFDSISLTRIGDPNGDLSGV